MTEHVDYMNSFTEYKESIRGDIIALSDLLLQLAKDWDFISAVKETCDVLEKCIRGGNKILIAGNGGSAADSQHFASELMSRFLIERGPIRAIALSTDTSILTAVGNDYGFDQIFVRQLEGLGDPGDVFIAITTSGKSRNLINGIKQSIKMGIRTVALCGEAGVEQGLGCDTVIKVTTHEVPRIQEAHSLVIHSICCELEQRICR